MGELEQLRERDAKVALDTIQSARRRADEAEGRLEDVKRGVDEQLKWFGMRKVAGRNVVDDLSFLFEMFRQSAEKNVALNKRLEESRDRNARTGVQLQELRSELKAVRGGEVRRRGLGW